MAKVYDPLKYQSFLFFDITAMLFFSLILYFKRHLRKKSLKIPIYFYNIINLYKLRKN